MNTKEFAELRKLFNQEKEGELYSVIKDWEYGKLAGAEVDKKFGIKSGLHHHDRKAPKGMTNPEASKNNPLFTDFIELGHAKDIPKIAPVILYEDKEMILFLNNKTPLIKKDGERSAAMSYVHLLAVPKIRKYNCISLAKEDIPLLENMMRKINKIYSEKCNKIFSTFVEKALLTDLVENVDDFELDDEKLEQNVEDLFNSILSEYKQIKGSVTDIEKNNEKLLTNFLSERIMLMMASFNKVELEKCKLQFYTHVHPHHSIGQLHLQCILPEVKTRMWRKLIGEMVSVEDVISCLQNE